MKNKQNIPFVGKNPYQLVDGEVNGKILSINDQSFYCIENYNVMPPFFMSLVSASDHWMFISSTGGLTAGRMNVDSSLFPYETDDKITEHAEMTGSKTILLVVRDDKTFLWEPFSIRLQGQYATQRNLYKNKIGTEIFFEEINHDLNLKYQYSWRTSDKFGLVKSAALENLSDQPITVHLLDGVQYLLPYGIENKTQNIFSNLLNAYKRNELEPETNIGMFTLSSSLSDLPEANESLMATTAWQWGLEAQAVLLSSKQLDLFRAAQPLTTEYDLRGERGAYFVQSNLTLQPEENKQWNFVLEVNQQISDVIDIKQALHDDPDGLWLEVENDIAAGNQALIGLVASADGLQHTADLMINSHHFANVLFNIMRGGIFDDHYNIEKADFLAYLRLHNRQLGEELSGVIQSLPSTLTLHELLEAARHSDSPDFLRLCYEFLPLMFSRRHGDPSRPWNQFSINLKNPDGSRRLDFQGNWRDIFQNWEPLAVSYPEFIESFIFKFLNATTGDGYNPYRLTFSGFEWEVPNPDDPWGNIGYWGDHQIIYLQKLIELSQQFHPELLNTFLQKSMFVHANVPYRIKPYQDILEDWHHTINFDHSLNTAIKAKVENIGADGKLMTDPTGNILHVTLAEKMLNLLLAKVVNFIPEGGIWMNTQRPEWNDANNALAGKGISVVTTAYLSRYVQSFRKLLLASQQSTFTLSSPLVNLFQSIHQILATFQADLITGFNDSQRFTVISALGEAGTQYRQAVYAGDLGVNQANLTIDTLLEFLTMVETYLNQTLRANQRSDGLYHAYNVLQINGQSASIKNLGLMLEGQVAILSSGILTSQDALAILQALRKSTLYRADQHSYMLYPDRDLAGFLSKNVIPSTIRLPELLNTLLEKNDQRLINRDNLGCAHFHGAIHNERDVKRILNEIAKDNEYADLVSRDRDRVLQLFEEVFHHSAFTGRSGTFFGYEGLGSIYWHMVTKLLLAVQEHYWYEFQRGVDRNLIQELSAIYDDIRNGIGFNKTPAVYGSFPTDPYSHTPKGAGAKQPGMTGQVKEELMTRWRELGININNGRISFIPGQPLADEFLTTESQFTYMNIEREAVTLTLPINSLAFTFCQVPVIYHRSDYNQLQVHYCDQPIKTIAGFELSSEDSELIFKRSNRITQVDFFMKL